jgi:hypothetical protein
VDGWLPTGDRSRSVFVWLVLAGCLGIGVLEYIVIPFLFGTHPGSLEDVVDETLSNIVATALAATGLALLLFKIFPPPPRPAIVENVQAHEITGLLAEAIPKSKNWWFDGSTGRFQRAETLREMGKWARLDGTSREMTIVILDPQDEELCRRYANYRAGLQSGLNKNWTVDAVRHDIYATLLAALRFNETEPISVTLGLKSTMSILRYDLSDARIVITKEGKADPAITCPAKSFYYDTYLEQLRWGLKQARHLDLAQAVVPTGGFDVESARAAMRALDIWTETLDKHDVVDAIVTEATSSEHPYS